MRVEEIKMETEGMWMELGINELVLTVERRRESD